jgi:beta-lactamase regulating signal transducer with metallopeptidase domain
VPNGPITPKSTNPLNFFFLSLVVWVAGVLMAFVPTVIGMASLWHLRRHSRVVTERNWLELLERSSMCLSFTRTVALLKSGRRRMPMTWGWLRPKVLLPDEADDWQEERRRLVLLHELAHVKRWDYLTHLIARIACALYWFNPLAWVAARRMVIERERACDDIVLSLGPKPADYAEQLLQIAAGLKAHPFAACGAVAMARQSKLEGRLGAILDWSRNRDGVTGTTILAGVTVTALLVVPVAMLNGAGQNGLTQTASPVFGPVVERVLTGEKDEWAFDMDAGETHGPVVIGGDSVPPGQNMDLSVPYWKTGGQFRADRIAGMNGLVVVAVNEADWGAMSATQVQDQLKQAGNAEVGESAKSMELANRKDSLPRTYLFATRQGAFGVLQVLGFPQNPGGVRIRYKLVRDSDRAINAEANRDKARAAMAVADVERSAWEREARFRLQRAEEELERAMKLHSERLVSDDVLSQAKLKVELRKAELNGNAMEGARARLRHAEARLKRMEYLDKDRLVGRADLDHARMMVAVYKAELNGDAIGVARARLQQAVNELERISELRRSQLVSEAEYENAKAEAEFWRQELTARESGKRE